uniref:Uncharacterized protein n=1 Tax=viral metagenome TaxID=1070528 RepID=A0A6M3JRN9_9ZZZZ
MAWPTVRVWTTGEMVTAALLNAQVRDPQVCLNLHAHEGGSGSGTAGMGPLVSVGGAVAATAESPSVAALTRLFAVGTDWHFRSMGAAGGIFPYTFPFSFWAGGGTDNTISTIGHTHPGK